MMAAQRTIPVSSLEVEVQADYDDGALLGTTKVAPGYSEVRYTVTIESNAPEEDVLKMINDADLHSPYLDVFSRGRCGGFSEGVPGPSCFFSIAVLSSYLTNSSRLIK